jgi:hypothetical protein
MEAHINALDPLPIWFYTKHPCFKSLLTVTNNNLKQRIQDIDCDTFIPSSEDFLIVVQSRILEFLAHNFFDDSTDMVVTIPFGVVVDGLNTLCATTTYSRDAVAQAFSIVRHQLIKIEFDFMRDIAIDECLRYDPYIPFTIAEHNLEMLSKKYGEYQRRITKLALDDPRKPQYLWRMFVIEKVIESVSLKTVPFYSVLKKEFAIRNPQIQLRRVSMIENFIIIWCYATGNLEFVEQRR